MFQIRNDVFAVRNDVFAVRNDVFAVRNDVFWELRGADSAPPPNALSTPKNKIPAPSEVQGVVQGVFT